MNIFLPYEYDIKKSVQSLDDRRLIKQILEIYQLIQIRLKELDGQVVKSYSNHPIYLHYKDYLDFMIEYGLESCKEYKHRFSKTHSFHNKFIDLFFNKDSQTFVFYKPFYAEGSKKSKNCIRTSESVGVLYQSKLVNKWKKDKIKPRWTNRCIPEFYERSISGEEEYNF
jgi:hypothetical protein